MHAQRGKSTPTLSLPRKGDDKRSPRGEETKTLALMEASPSPLRGGDRGGGALTALAYRPKMQRGGGDPPGSRTRHQLRRAGSAS